jgi:hypothetical protein
MRSFINWDILQRIENSPKEFIVQRNVGLLNAFLFGYEIFFLQLKNEEQLKVKYDNVPSLDEYARNKYCADNIGTRNFTSIISFTCEDERDFFDKYLDFLKEYEQQYPVQETIFYTLKEKPFVLKELLTGMRKRYPMYFGYYDISCLRAFFDGYFLCKQEYNIPMTIFDTKVREFTESIICESLNITGEFVTWDRLYRYDRHWNAWGEIIETDAKKILEDFWIDLEKFTGETIN